MDREGLYRTRRPERGHLGHSGRWQDTKGNHNHSSIHLPAQQKPQTRGLEGYESRYSAPPTPQISFPKKHGQQEVQPSITLSRNWSKFPEDISQRYILQRPYAEPDRAYSDLFRITRSRPTQLSSGFTPFKHQKISGQESPLFTIPGFFQEKKGIKGQKQDIFQPKAERVGPNDPEAVVLGEISTQDPEIVVNTSRISDTNNINITPTQNEHSVTPESNLKSDSLWLQMSQFAEQTQKQFSDLQDSHERLKALTASMNKIVKALHEGHAQFIKALEEANKRLNKVFEKPHHCKGDRDCLDQDLNKLFNVYQNMNPQPQGHVLDTPYNQEDIKPDVLL
ncbi:hypothetical protein O181_019822 [Austropuccinia psidii MF-1]|uniref:Uncharacterized protein n=1 Tax=Austropuccinia psidii MF-1 TaxID=1389203 RepID=A0A9Q3CCC0_9BASI|nr:hypothetical protein [Austropuccinia psidii MF-1]